MKSGQAPRSKVHGSGLNEYKERKSRTRIRDTSRESIHKAKERSGFLGSKIAKLKERPASGSEEAMHTQRGRVYVRKSPKRLS